MTVSVWFALLIFHFLRLKFPQWEVALLPLSMIGFLLMGWSSTTATAASPLSAALDNVWLFIHASFATFGASSFLIAASLAAVYLIGNERLRSMESVVSRLPDHARLPSSMSNFLIFGLILWGVMIVSGAIWANAAWGRYWAWDPIELWSLISWLLYGLLIHARMAFKLSQRLFCWLTIVAAATVVFALWGVGYVYETIHTYG
jgi:ABC-type transport system involved in cytochrome c biogenesis permease subunit